MVNKGYTLLILLFAVSILTIGLLIAMPVWQTQIQREKEEELIFRGKQYMEAIRLYQTKKPGQYPRTLDDLIEEKCLRRLYKDPMTAQGEWNIILPYQRGATSRTRRPQPRQRGRQPRAGETSEATQSFQKVYIVPSNVLSSVDNPAIIGVVSSSTKKAFKIYLNESTYDKWLFMYGLDPQSMPEIVYYGQEEKK
jgi:type II secretory pathway pseudopilin PulG